MQELTPVQLEANFLRQEHRLFVLLKNYINRKRYDREDPRYDAIVSAMIWRVVMSLIPTSAALAVTSIGFLGLWFAFSANKLLNEQNELFKAQNVLVEIQTNYFKDQNTHFETQNKAISRQFEASERTLLLRTLFEVKQLSVSERILGLDPEPVASPRSRAEAFLAFIELERVRLERLGTPDAKIDLTNVLLQNTSLRGVALDLTNVILDKAHLEEADLSMAKFEKADFFAANLEGANLRSAHLEGANFYQANLKGANLWRARLKGANLQGACLDEANLRGARLEEANFYLANLQKAFLFTAHLQGANLRGANLSDTNFNDAELQNAIIMGIHLTGAKLEGADFRYANLEGVYVDIPNWITRTNKIAKYFEEEHWEVIDNGKRSGPGRLKRWQLMPTMENPRHPENSRK